MTNTKFNNEKELLRRDTEFFFFRRILLCDTSFMLDMNTWRSIWKGMRVDKPSITEVFVTFPFR